MMSYRRGRSALRVGLVTLLGALSFGVLFFYSTARVLGAQRSTLFVRLNAADGLQRGDAVLHRGVNVGQVKAVDFAGDDVVIRVRAADGGSRVDVRSLSRVGGGDVGTNAKRIREFLTRLRAAS